MIACLCVLCVLCGKGDPQGQRKFLPVRLKEITDGTTQTAMVGEYQTTSHRSRRTFWAYAYASYNQSSALVESRSLLADFDKCEQIGGVVDGCKRAWGSLHAGGIIQFVYCDGSVRGVSTEIDQMLFVASGTIARGDDFR